ncbi:molybdopterin-guanine dinucleotide biosynthesis protein A [Salibacterium salarium]|uniref:molybdenum cofactor guanylyltransferase n=1 Tax=Salibacterium salarium TaxID=284579 RepID=UPI00277E36A1|nr:hypothetical protein [Salibacterium salarium]MDQ0300348.1 molybdopterin-guanine dinucleotide biosynthesis protein A [Salibacterium salarium]
MGLSGVIIDKQNEEEDKRGNYRSILSLAEKDKLERRVSEMRQVCSEIILITNRPEIYLPLIGNSIRIITEFYKGKGLIGNIYTAFSLAKGSFVWLVEGNNFIVSPEAAKFFVYVQTTLKLEAIIPVYDGEKLPSNGVYRICHFPILDSLVQKKDVVIQDFLNQINYEEFDENFLK